VTGARTAFAALPEAPICTEAFEGPIQDLLRRLDEGDLEITAVAVAAVVDQYVAHVHLLPPGHRVLEALSELLVVAAQLLLTKSRALLPREAAAAADDGLVAGQTLEERLAEYRRYRDAAARLAERLARGERAFVRTAPPVLPPPAPRPLESAEPELLARALQRLLATRPPVPDSGPATPPRITLAECIRQVRRAVRGGGRITFSLLTATIVSRTELITTFLAILELHRARAIRLEQDGLFGEIWVVATDELDAHPDPLDDRDHGDRQGEPSHLGGLAETAVAAVDGP
jgi:segregation and condensation protein A